MLVLALQFSRGDEARPAQRNSLELDADGHSLTTEERTEPTPGPDAGGEPTTTSNPSDDPPVHQLGRCLGPGWPNGHPSEEYSLERR